MDSTQLDLGIVIPAISLISAGVSALLAFLISSKTTQAIMNERLANIKETLDEYKRLVSVDMEKIRSENASSTELLMDYIQRVENNKADRSEVNLIIESTKRIEQKLDSLILRDSNK